MENLFGVNLVLIDLKEMKLDVLSVRLDITMKRQNLKLKMTV